MEHIAHKQPRNFREALQMIYMVHMASVNEDAISGMSPGRIGQVLWPWFEQDMEAGRITEAEVLELLECYRVKMTCIDCFASMGVVGGVLSGNTFNNVCLGGLTRDGQPAANRLEMLLLEAGMTCQTTQPTLSVLYDDKLPEEFLLKAVECEKSGTGYPAWMNNRAGRYEPGRCPCLLDRRLFGNFTWYLERTGIEWQEILDPGRRRSADFRRCTFYFQSESFGNGSYQWL